MKLRRRTAVRHLVALLPALAAAQSLAAAPAASSARGAPTATAATKAAQAPAGGPAPSGADAAIAPFSAHYLADWKSINVGTSDLELKQDTEPGHYLYTWTITARGIFRLYRSEVTQKSWLSINGDHVRPDKYRAEDGSSTRQSGFRLECGARQRHVRKQTGRSEAQGGDAGRDVHSGRGHARPEKRRFAEDLSDHRQGSAQGIQLHATKGTPASEPPSASSTPSSCRAGRPATIASCACGSRLHWDSCRFKPSAPATANSNSRCTSNPWIARSSAE